MCVLQALACSLDTTHAFEATLTSQMEWPSRECTAVLCQVLLHQRELCYCSIDHHLLHVVSMHFTNSYALEHS